MNVDDALLEPEPDPEQTGIILDLLAKELEHALGVSPVATAELVDDAHTFLGCIRDWLGLLPGDLGVAAVGVQAIGDPRALAQSLRGLADKLLELAEQSLAASSERA